MVAPFITDWLFYIFNITQNYKVHLEEGFIFIITNQSPRAYKVYEDWLVIILWLSQELVSKVPCEGHSGDLQGYRLAPVINYINKTQISVQVTC